MYYGDYGCDATYPAYSYGGYNCGGHVGSNFALIVVLFILLIIIGACWYYPK